VTRDRLPDQVRRVVHAVREVEPPDDLHHTVMREAEATPQDRGLRFGWLPVVSTLGAGVAALALAVIVAPLIGQFGKTGPSTGATSSAAATAIHATPAEISLLPVAGSIDMQIAVPAGAYPASADDSSIWLGDESTGQVHRLDIASGQISGSVQVNEPALDYNLWPISDGASVWTSGLEDRSLVRIDIGSMAVADRFAIEAVPYRIAPVGSSVWVTDFDDSQVLEIDASTGEVLMTVAMERPTGIAVTPTAVWVATYRGVLGRIDPESGEVVFTSTIAPRATDLHLQGDQLWITGIRNRRLERFDTTTETLAARTDGVTAVAFIADRPWAAVTAGALVALDPVTLEWTGAVPLGDVTTDQMVSAAGELWAYGATADETRVYRIRPD
jgi:streptogramin lyase